MAHRTQSEWFASSAARFQRLLNLFKQSSLSITGRACCSSSRQHLGIEPEEGARPAVRQEPRHICPAIGKIRILSCEHSTHWLTAHSSLNWHATLAGRLAWRCLAKNICKCRLWLCLWLCHTRGQHWRLTDAWLPAVGKEAPVHENRPISTAQHHRLRKKASSNRSATRVSA